MEVKLAYETDGGTTRRVLADNQGRVCERPAEGCPYWSASTVVH